ncbi:MAG: Ig-like domain-containing protein [bacterium]|nr:Ig-like domain-containing protein [bacterium]
MDRKFYRLIVGLLLILSLMNCQSESGSSAQDNSSSTDTTSTTTDTTATDGPTIGAPGSPTYGPLVVTFVDVGQSYGKLTGTLSLMDAVDESDITGYRVYWGSTETQITPGSAPIFDSTVNEANHKIVLTDQDIPAATGFFLGFSYNENGLNARPTAWAVVDYASTSTTTTTTTTSSTSDTTGPSLVSTSPSGGGTGVSVIKDLTVTFDEALSSSSVNASTVVLTQNGTTLSGTASASNQVITFTPSQALLFGKTYNLSITTGVKDAAGNAINYPVSVTFTTEAEPTLSQISLSDQAGCAALSNKLMQCWGDTGDYLRSPTASSDQSLLPAISSSLGDVVEVEIGSSHACARTSTGTVQCAGINWYGQLGDPNLGWFTHQSTVVGLSNVTQLVTYGHSNCALTGSGIVYCWGYGYYGALGNGNDQNQSSIVPVTGISTATQISMTNGFGCARLSSGQVSCWGHNNYRQLGDGTTIDRWVPVMVSGVTNAVSVYTGNSRACAVLTDATVKCWGNSGFRLFLADPTAAASTTATTLAGLTSVKALALGSGNICSLHTDGSVKCWGLASYGANGLGDLAWRYQPTLVPGLAGVQQIVANTSNGICARLSSGKILCWGSNDYGQLGNGNTTSQSLPSLVGKAGLAQVGPSSTARSLTFIDQNHTAGTVQGTLGITLATSESDLTDYVVYWGSNSYTKLSGYAALATLPKTGASQNFNLTARSLPNGATHLLVYSKNSTGEFASPASVKVVDSIPVTDLAASNFSTCAKLSDGTAKCWGLVPWMDQTTSGPLNRVPGLSNLSKINMGDYFYCALLTTGSVQCSGASYHGELGDGLTYSSIDSGALKPLTVPGISNPSALISSTQATCAILAGGNVKCWGYLTLPSEAGTTHRNPVNYLATSSYVDAAFGSLEFFGRTAAGAIYSVNRNTGASTLQTALAGATQVTGSSAFYILRTDGTLRCWGSNYYGQCGNNSTTTVLITSPATVSGLTGITQISSKGSHACALKSDGTVWCWGHNLYGQLGNNSTTNSSVPVQVSGITTATKVAAGSTHSCALLSDGTVKCWGSNYRGAVSEALSNSLNLLTPVTVDGL